MSIAIYYYSCYSLVIKIFQGGKMQRQLLALIFLCSNSLFALEFNISPSMKYDLTKDNFYATDPLGATAADSEYTVKRSGTMLGLGLGVNSPVVKHNWINSAKASFAYGIFNTEINDGAGSANESFNMSLKLWQLGLEDTVAFYAKVNSKTAPYIGVGFAYEKFELADEEIYNEPASPPELSKGHNKRLYVPVGFIVHTTDFLSFDVRYEKDLGEKYNESEAYLNPELTAADPRKFVRGQGIAIAVNWDFAPVNNTGMTLKYQRHTANYARSVAATADKQKYQEQVSDSVLLQFHWLGDF